jgi:PAS domain S-box-containing protein
MQLHSILEKQVSQYFTPECLGNHYVQQFLAAVNNSYLEYDHEQARALHAFHLSKQVYLTINNQLKAEIGLKEKGLSDLKEVIRNLADEDEPDNQTDDLITALALLNKHIERRNRIEAELLQNQEQLKQLSLVASLNENGVIFTDPEGAIFYANDGFSKMTGYDLSEIAGKTPIQLCRGELTDNDLLRNMVVAFTEGKTFNIEVAHYRKDGSYFWGRVKGQPVLDDKGAILNYFAVVEDITDKKNADGSKEAFLANMSHEIRTPMNAILGMGRQLKKTALDEKQQLFLDTINTAAENLLVIINDILDISKIEAGKLAIEHIGFSMSGLLSKAARVMMHKAEEKGLQLSFSTDAGVPGILLGDPHRLNQVILNLVSNAIKFTEHGSVAIRCFTSYNQATTELLCLEVKDTGIGMDEAFLRHLFQKFLQEDVSVVRKYGGTGLGMSISKQLVELMGGTIGVTSEKGKGTAVLLCIPLQPGTEADLPVKKEMVSDIGILQGKKILLVEDNEMNRLVATMVLNNYGALVTEVIDGWEAVKAVKQDHYDLVLMDVQMPVMDGYKATRLIRQHGYHQLPVVALTANAIKGEYEKCRKAGMNGYISKPFEEDELIRTLADMLGSTLAIPAVEKPAITCKSLYSTEKLQQISPGDPSFLEKMLQLFLMEVPAAVQCIRQAFSGHDLKKVQAVAHRIKPALDNLCIQSLTTEIRELEQMAKEGKNPSRMEAIIKQLEEVIGLVAEDIKRYPV